MGVPIRFRVTKRCRMGPTGNLPDPPTVHTQCDRTPSPNVSSAFAVNFLCLNNISNKTRGDQTRDLDVQKKKDANRPPAPRSWRLRGGDGVTALQLGQRKGSDGHAPLSNARQGQFRDSGSGQPPDLLDSRLFPLRGVFPINHRQALFRQESKRLLGLGVGRGLDVSREGCCEIVHKGLAQQKGIFADVRIEIGKLDTLELGDQLAAQLKLCIAKILHQAPKVTEFKVGRAKFHLFH